MEALETEKRLADVYYERLRASQANAAKLAWALEKARDKAGSAPQGGAQYRSDLLRDVLDILNSALKEHEAQAVDVPNTYAEKALAAINTTIYAAGAPLGSSNYFLIREICCNVLHGQKSKAAEAAIEAQA